MRLDNAWLVGQVLVQGKRGTLVVKPTASDTCFVNFKASTIDGNVFDSNSKRLQPAEIKPAEVVLVLIALLSCYHTPSCQQ